MKGFQLSSRSSNLSHRSIGKPGICVAENPGLVVSLLAATIGIGVFDRLFYGLTGFTGAFLNTTDEFCFFAFGKLEIVVCEIRPLFLELALDNIPFPFDFEFVHYLENMPP